MTGKELIVVNGADGTAGRIVYGKLKGTVEVDTLADVWEEKGLDKKLLPQQPTLEYALRRAFKELGAKRMLVRPLGDDVDGYALVHEDAQGSDLDHEVELKGEIVKGSDGERHLQLTPHDHPMAEQVKRRFLEAQDELDTTLFSNWFWTKIPPHVDAVCHRPKGGMYFVPRHRLDEWYKVVAAVQEVSEHRIFNIPAMYCDEAIEAILDAVTTEAEEMAKKIDAELKAAQAGAKEMGVRAMNNRVALCDAAAEKLEAYEDLLGAKLDAIQERVGDLQAQYTQAALLAQAEADKARELAQKEAK
jgi:hypothetical protein